MGIYAKVLKVPGFAVLITSTMVTRLPFAINGLAVILFLRAETGSFATAGLAAGALALGAGIGAPVAGRLVDRRGAVMLMPLAFGHAAAILSLWALGEADAATPALVSCAAVAGVCFPPSGSVLRSRWNEMMDGDAELLRGAFAFDSVMIEVSFVSGPLITAVLVALIGPQAALAASAILVVAGTALFVWKLPEARRVIPLEDRVGGFGPLRAPAIRAVALSTVPFGFCIGTIEVALPAFSEATGSAALAGVLLALWSLGSGVGGLTFGARPLRGDLFAFYLGATLLFPLVCLPLALASTPLAMGILVVAAGAPIAPLIATRNQLVASLAPAGTGTEAFSWLMTSLIAGVSLGTAIAGTVVESNGWEAAVLVGVAVALAGSAGSFFWRGAIRPEPAPA
ncbi:MAG TPA: MFS transporter [Solirubrobacterales bacterium]|nr:MFS transporter [Solirubrobacterales bacterium]